MSRVADQKEGMARLEKVPASSEEKILEDAEREALARKPATKALKTEIVTPEEK